MELYWKKLEKIEAEIKEIKYKVNALLIISCIGIIVLIFESC